MCSCSKFRAKGTWYSILYYRNENQHWLYYRTRYLQFSWQDIYNSRDRWLLAYNPWRIVQGKHFFVLKNINTIDNISKCYQIYRSFRRTFTFIGTEAGILDKDKWLVTRWRQIERSGGKKPRFTMPDHYTDIALRKLRSSDIQGPYEVNGPDVH